MSYLNKEVEEDEERKISPKITLCLLEAIAKFINKIIFDDYKKKDVNNFINCTFIYTDKLIFDN